MLVIPLSAWSRRFKNCVAIHLFWMESAMQMRSMRNRNTATTGKTAAFTIPLLEQLKTEDTQIQGLIVVPTRELALQVLDLEELFESSAPVSRIFFLNI